MTSERARREGQPVSVPVDLAILWLPAQADRPDRWAMVTVLGGGRRVGLGGARATVRIEDPAGEPDLVPGRLLNTERKLLVAPSKIDQAKSTVESRRAAGLMPLGSRPILCLDEGGWAFDLRCPVHWIIHTAPKGVCSGEPVVRMPLAGDAVRLASPWAGQPTGAIGVIGGDVGRALRFAQITFQASTFRDDEVVSCGGGPGTVSTEVAELVATDDHIVVPCWQWRYGLPGGGMGEDYRLEVPVWE